MKNARALKMRQQIGAFRDVQVWAKTVELEFGDRCSSH